MYAFMFFCMYACIYVCIYVFLYVCMYACKLNKVRYCNLMAVCLIYMSSQYINLVYARLNLVRIYYLVFA